MSDLAADPELDLRGRLVRRLGALREMLPGSFVERSRPCGKPSCRCADGKQLHRQFLLSVLIEGKPKVFHVPAKLADQVRSQVELRKSFEQAAAQIAHLNLRRFLRRKERP
jgi:hypothetical protein